MASYLGKRMVPVTPLTTSQVTLYTVPGSTVGVIKQIILTNVTTVSATATVNIVQAAGSASASNRIISAMEIPPNQFEVIDLNQVMTAADFISATASAGASINISVSGFEVS